jgi:hypothetical protein
MRNALAVRDVERSKDLAGNATRFDRFDGASGKEIGQRETRDALHDDEGSLGRV